MSSLKLNEKIHFGKCAGKRPIDLIRSKSKVDIRYLLWLREQRKGKFPAYSFDQDLHHTLDAVIRSNSALYGSYEQRYNHVEYDLWRAEKRIQIETEKKKKEIEKAERELTLAIIEKRRKQREAREKEKAMEIMRKERERKALLALEEKNRQEAYSATWGDWK